MYRARIWLVAATSVCALIAESAAKGGEMVPIKGWNVGTMVLESVDFDRGVAVVVRVANGRSTLLGRHSTQSELVVDLQTGALLSNTTTFRAANGDTLIVSDETIAVRDPFTNVTLATVIEGTGRFAGASGQYISVNRGDKPLTPENLPIRLTSVWSGAITSPGASKR